MHDAALRALRGLHFRKLERHWSQQPRAVGAPEARAYQHLALELLAQEEGGCAPFVQLCTGNAERLA